MNPAPLRLKRASGWFAAGREVAEALTLLSDAGFKLFIWLCLHADRSRGTLRLEPKDIAGALGKGETEIVALMQHLFLSGICRRNTEGHVEIADRFWPYARAAPAQASGAEVYLARVKKTMLERACVHSAFAAADQKLALQMYACGTPIEHVERAIHLGCLRKYATLLNGHGGTLITTLHYFARLFDEVERLNIFDDYWCYVALKVEKLERQWCQARTTSSRKPPATTETK